VRRRVIDVEIVLLDVLAVIALGAGDAEKAFLEDGVLAVPEGRCEAEQLIAIADAGDAVLAPAIGPAAGVVVRQVVPGVAVGAVVLADGPPGSIGEIGAPAAPAEGVVVVGNLQQAIVFFGGDMGTFEGRSSSVRSSDNPVSLRWGLHDSFTTLRARQEKRKGKILVPKLCLGMQGLEALLPLIVLPRSRASHPCVPKQSLGTRVNPQTM